jgi:dipeptidyl aminopeptidase/acylaminoacyl peptidase
MMEKLNRLLALIALAVGIVSCTSHPTASSPNEARSPTDNRTAVVRSRLIDGKQQSELLILDQGKETVLFRYPSLDYGVIDLVWSPDGKWIAFVPRNAAFAIDAGLWVFSTDGAISHNRINAHKINGWTADSQYVSFQMKDYCGYLGVVDWEEHRCP